MRRVAIEAQNRVLLERQRRFRMAADIVADAFAAFAEVQAVAVIGSVARPLRKEVPRFREFRRRGIELWHECGDLDLAVWVDSQHQLGEMRRARALALRDAELGVSDHQVEVFLIEPGTDAYLGRLCHYGACPKGKPDCLVPGCGAVPFNRRFPDFIPRPDLLEPTGEGMLYRRGAGRLRSALDLPSVAADSA